MARMRDIAAWANVSVGAERLLLTSERIALSNEGDTNVTDVDQLSPRESWMKDLAARITGPKFDRPAPPGHVLQRLASVLALSEVRWVESSLNHEAGLTMSGEILVFTERHLARVVMDGISADRRFQSAREPGSTTAAVFPRRTLRSLEMLHAEDDYTNSAAAWSDSSADVEWPFRAELTLTYEGALGRIRLPLAYTDTQDLNDLIPSLLDDLAR